MQESPCLVFHYWHGGLLSLCETSHKISNISRKQVSIVVSATSQKNAASILPFTQSMWGFFPYISSRRWKIIVFVMLSNDEKQTNHSTYCMPFGRFGLVSSDCHSKLHHLSDARLQKNVAILPIIARSSLRHIPNTLFTARYPIDMCNLKERKKREGHLQLCSGQCTSQSTHHWYKRTRSGTPDINAKVVVELCGALELFKYHSNYPPYEIYDYEKYDA
jgi:hypothetical protein